MILLALEMSNPSAMSAAAAAIAIARIRNPENAETEVLTALNAFAQPAADTTPDETPTARPIDPASLIERALQEAGLAPRDVTDIAVSVGPGGYTATRTATAASAALALATGARLHAVPTPSIASNAMQDRSGHHAVILARKRDTAHRSLFPPHSNIPIEQSVLPIAEIAVTSPSRLAADVLTIAALQATRLLPESTSTETLKLCATNMITALPAAREVSPAALHPVYPREPEAVANWRKLHPR